MWMITLRDQHENTLPTNMPYICLTMREEANEMNV